MDAQFELAIAYGRGDGVPRDLVEAYKWMLKAAQQGHTKAQARLGEILQYGLGKTQNFSEAVVWYLKAADKGDASAQFLLGRAYVLGEGVEKNAVEATRWIGKSADQGNAEAQYSMGMGLSGSDDPERQNEGAKWYRRAAAQGHAYSQYQLALLFIQGRRGGSLPSTTNEVLALLDSSAQQGIPEAQLMLGSLCAQAGRLAEGADWTKRAAEQGFADAQLILATYFEAGRGVPQDFVQAHMWANLAASNGASNIAVGSAADLGDRIASKMTATQIETAQRQASEWRPQAAAGSRH